MNNSRAVYVYLYVYCVYNHEYAVTNFTIHLTQLYYLRVDYAIFSGTYTYSKGLILTHYSVLEQNYVIQSKLKDIHLKII